MPSTSGSYGRLAGRLTYKMRLDFKIFKIPYRLCYFLLRLISLQSYYSVINVFQSAFLSITYFKVCFEACKIWLPFVFMSMPTVKY